MLKLLRDIAATAGIIIVIGVVIFLIPMISVILTGVGTFLLLCFLALIIFAGFRAESEDHN